MKPISKKYYIYIDNLKTWREVDGTPVYVKGLEGLNFFLHQFTGESIIIRPWRVSEATSGGEMAGGSTKKQAIKLFRDRMKQVMAKLPKSEILDTIAAIIKVNGISPRYRKESSK